MTEWWDDDPGEIYWVEISHRNDVGADLKAPQADSTGSEYWSYSLMKEVRSGDLVFHYSGRARAFVGASIAGGPLQERGIRWEARGTAQRVKEHSSAERPGWWLPLHGFTAASQRLTLEELRKPENQDWIRSWLERHSSLEPLRSPFQNRRDGLRANQGYLTKMPAQFVDRFGQLSALRDELINEQDELTRIDQFSVGVSPAQGEDDRDGFNPKDDGDYFANIAARQERRSRKHETLVARAGAWLQARGARVSTPHPVDLQVDHPIRLMLEVKTARGGSARMGIRDAVGQVLEYRHFIPGCPDEAGILIDVPPNQEEVSYVERTLELSLLWWTGGRLHAGPQTRAMLAANGLELGETVSDGKP